ncbi:MAG TPA: DNA polymerase Y family protein [Candidatus Acidoferrum sp.]|nr:DNA polymerase Y family protein [Candidatus Acidoferrum sp.]
MSHFACAWVPCFAAAAFERAEPALVDRPLVIVRGTPPVARVAEASAAAREHRIAPGMTETEARARCPLLVVRPWSDARVDSARHALLEAALTVSPRVEDGGPGLVHVDVAGLGRLVGDARAIADRLVRQVSAVGLSARVGIAQSRVAARLAAQGGPRLTVVPSGGERALLAAVPLSALELGRELIDTFRGWGVRTLGELAGLPRRSLGDRLGAAGLRAHDLALGLDRDPFRVHVPEPYWEEMLGLEWEIVSLDALAAVIERVLERLTTRLAVVHVSADAVDLELTLASGTMHQRAIALAYPTRDVRLILTLIRLDLETHPPPAAVVGVTLRARPAVARPTPAELWQPPAPAHRDLASLLTRLTALVGAGNLGAAALVDSHRPDAFTLGPFTGAAPSDPAVRADAAGEPDPRMMLRRAEPPLAVSVETGDGRPRWLTSEGTRARVLACAGPWRISGEWWDTRAWARDEWDVLLSDTRLCRLAHDRLANHWHLVGLYD